MGHVKSKTRSLGQIIEDPMLVTKGLWFKSLLFTHYHTMPHFDALNIDSCGKHCEKKENLLVTKVSQNDASYTDTFGVVKLKLEAYFYNSNQIVIPIFQ